MSPDPAQIRVAMLADNEFVMDRRIYREAKAITEAGYCLTLYAVQRKDLLDKEVIDGIRVERIFSDKIFNIKAPAYLQQIAEILVLQKPHVVHCHDWIMLHVGVLIKKLLPQVILIYDSHELFHSWPIHYSSQQPDIVIKTWLVRQYEILREKRDAAYIDRLITVSTSIAKHLENYFKLHTSPSLVRNFAELEEVTSQEDFVRKAFNLPATVKVVVLFAYLVYRKKRNIETVIDQLANVSDIAFVIFCKSGGHKQYFVDMVKKRGIRNVYFHEAIPAKQIVNYLASCDVGLIPTWNKKHLSYWLGLENKLFHYIMSELPVLASAQPEHKHIVEGFDIGVCVNGEEEMSYAVGLSTILNNYNRYKQNVIKAKNILCWDMEKQTLLKLYANICSNLNIQSALPTVLSPTLRYCIRCIFNTQSDPDLYFDDAGLCNHCQYYDEKIKPLQRADQSTALNDLISRIKEDGKNKRYDCIIGVSGGVDSSYVAHLVKDLGLRPLAVHCDNGWNTELAVTNISNLLKGLSMDLYTHVIDWNQFKDLQLSYLKASVIDIEVPSDHAIFSVMYNTAAKFGVRYILSGHNLSTEGYLPEPWVYLKNDLVNLKAIHRQFGTLQLKGFPTKGYFKQLYFDKIKRIQFVSLLDFMPYNKNEVKALLAERYNWVDYGGKHYESIFTRFYQSFILPYKFGVDKRYSHYSTLICSGQMTRREALSEISKPPFDSGRIESDERYVLKKLGLTKNEFDSILALPVRSHLDYPSQPDNIEKLRPLIELYKWLLGKPLTYKVKRKRSAAILIDETWLPEFSSLSPNIFLADVSDITIFAVKNPLLPSYEIRNGIKIRRVFEPETRGDKKLKVEGRRIAQKGFIQVFAEGSRMSYVAEYIKRLTPDCEVITNLP